MKTFTLDDLPQDIAAKIEVDETTGCWLWQGNVTPTGYGRIPIRIRRGAWQVKGIHRHVYELLVGPIEDQIDHVRERGCVHKHCCNPAHLEDVTCAENIRRAAALITHCPHGHDYTPENTIIGTSGRSCHTCYLASQAEQRRKNPKPKKPFRVERACLVCGVTFLAEHQRRVYCGPECVRVAHLRRRREMGY